MLFYARGLIKDPRKNTLTTAARCFSEQELQKIVAGFEYAIEEKKYQRLLAETTCPSEIDGFYRKILTLLQTALQNGLGVLYVPDLYRMDLATGKRM